MSALTKRHAKALERAFDAEIQGAASGLRWPAYPVRLGPKIAEELRALGYVEQADINVLGKRLLSSMNVSGWVLTQDGRLAYCLWATERGPVDEAAEAAS